MYPLGTDQYPCDSSKQDYLVQTNSYTKSFVLYSD